MTPTLRTLSAGRSFGERAALSDLTLELAPGSRIALAGPSGSGKTTLLRLLAGSLRPTAGSVEADGRSLSAMSPRQLRDHRRRCGIVTQGSALVRQTSVHSNVIAGRLAQWPWWKALAATVFPLEKAETATLLASVGLADRQWDIAGTLSGGQQQRVAIARALAASPSLILADEPTAALDPTTARQIADLLLEHAQRRAATLVFSTHWLSLVQPHCDRVIGLKDGRVLIDAPAADVSDADLDELYAGSGERR